MNGSRLTPLITRLRTDHSSAEVTGPKEIFITWLAIAAVILAGVMFSLDMSGPFMQQWKMRDWQGTGMLALLVFIVAFLVYGSLVYLYARLAYLRRKLSHRPASRAQLEAMYDGAAPTLTILIPSYKEDESVVMQTLWSAALQDYPERRVVLLIDNPPHPDSVADAAELRRARALPGLVQGRLARQRHKMNSALSGFLSRTEHGATDFAQEIARLADLYTGASVWFQELAGDQHGTAHADRIFVDRILLWHRDAHLERARDLRLCLHDARYLTHPELLREYRRLVALFSAELSVFERKRYVNLSHEPNKAMNLNSYIGLAGKSLRARQSGSNLFLDEVVPSAADFSVPDTDYFITLDADSLVMPDYAQRLVHFMEQPDNARVAVAQTPYSAIPGAPGVLERVAGATTDIQYIIHQGFTGYGATYWVGANALLRKTALVDIAATEQERGFTVTRYIHDRTVIEDTESSIDLVARGWQLYNYPERLAYSATPPDFGSLVIQRRRWANGGLIILPKLLRYLARTIGRQASIAQGLMRFHYLTSIAAVNAGLLIMLSVPFSGIGLSAWLPLTAVPYFMLYMRDLSQAGYRKSDLLRVYALNLLLMPVNIAGVLKSLQQGWTGMKIPFARTPKIAGRTSSPAIYIVAPAVLVVHWFIQAGLDMAHGLIAHGVFAAMNAAFLLYAFIAFVGPRAAREDILNAIREHVQNDRKPLPQAPIIFKGTEGVRLLRSSKDHDGRHVPIAGVVSGAECSSRAAEVSRAARAK